MKKIIKSEQEWRAQLSPEAYRITREKGTESPFSGDDFGPNPKGTFRCVCCSEPLFDSKAKFDSGSGWPSFTQPTESGGVDEHVDRSHGMSRTEVTCKRCDAHLGHVFPDGPVPTGLRYCINAAALALDSGSE